MSPFSPAQLAADENNNATVFNFSIILTVFIIWERAKRIAGMGDGEGTLNMTHYRVTRG